VKTSFYNRTAYLFVGVPVPDCFLQLDKHFDTRFTTVNITHPSVILAENLCRRMADAEFYAHSISEALKNPNAFHGANLIGTLLVGYFTACKSLLDAGSITLAKVYGLTLTNKEMDFSKPKFWKELDKEAGPTVNSRYAPFKGLFKEVINWRDSAVHRLTPFVVVHTAGKPDKAPREKMEIKMVSQPDAGVSMVVKAPKSIQWVEPLYFHNKWQSQLRDFCEEVCSDIKATM
jgi:hypothetical protein